jgi:hypothetical protein
MITIFVANSSPPVKHHVDNFVPETIIDGTEVEYDCFVFDIFIPAFTVESLEVTEIKYLYFNQLELNNNSFPVDVFKNNITCDLPERVMINSSKRNVDLIGNFNTLIIQNTDLNQNINYCLMRVGEVPSNLGKLIFQMYIS